MVWPIVLHGSEQVYLLCAGRHVRPLRSCRKDWAANAGCRITLKKRGGCNEKHACGNPVSSGTVRNLRKRKLFIVGILHRLVAIGRTLKTPSRPCIRTHELIATLKV